MGPTPEQPGGRFEQPGPPQPGRSHLGPPPGRSHLGPPQPGRSHTDPSGHAPSDVGEPARRRRGPLAVLLVLGLLAGLLGLILVPPIELRPFADPEPAPSPPAAPLADGRLLPPVDPATAGTYAFLNTLPSSEPVTFDPCRPIQWELNPTDMPDEVEPLLHEAVGDVSARTGLRFDYLGRTDRQAGGDWRGTRDRPVLIRWSDAEATEELAGEVLGFAGPTRVGVSGRPETQRYVSGQMTLDAPELADLVQRSPARVRLVIQHELAHIVGLGHVADDGELMAADLTSQRGWGPGDLQGLALLGRGTCA